MTQSKAVVSAPKGQLPKRLDFKKRVAAAELELANAREPADALAVEKVLNNLENIMHDAGLYTPDEIREVNEFRMRARWQLGGLLEKVERGAEPGRGKKKDDTRPSFLQYIKNIGLDKQRAIEAQRIHKMPKPELEKALKANARQGVLTSYANMVHAARPFWYKAARKAKHERINRTAAATKIEAPIGPFPLIYADPPTQFKTYSEAGLSHAPDQHYETLTDEEIQNFKVGDQLARDIAHKDAALLLWCTSSNIQRALKTMEAWGFEFKASAVWDKGAIGNMGLVFRNQHEILLYGTRGNMPAPQYQPPSVFRYPRGEHSAKPPEIRAEIEKMYPDFGKSTRLELFPGVDEFDGWTTYGKSHRTVRREAAE